MSKPDKFDRKRVKAHHLRGHGVDRNHVSAGKNVVLDLGNHAAWTRPVTGERAIHHGEKTGVNFFLNGQQIH